MLSAVTISEIQEVMLALVERAKRGNISAAREVLDRCVGKTSEQEVIERLAELEAIVLTTQGEALGDDSVRSNVG
jgi:ribosomal protein L17